MAKYLVTARSFIGNRIVEEGEVVEYDFTPGKHLLPVEDVATKAPRARKAAEAKTSDIATLFDSGGDVDSFA